KTQPNTAATASASSKFSSGWTLHKKGDEWLIYLIIDKRSMDAVTASLMEAKDAPLEIGKVADAQTLWREVRKQMADPQLLENALGVLPRQVVTEHLSHDIHNKPDVVQWSYEI